MLTAIMFTFYFIYLPRLIINSSVIRCCTAYVLLMLLTFFSTVPLDISYLTMYWTDLHHAFLHGVHLVTIENVVCRCPENTPYNK